MHAAKIGEDFFVFLIFDHNIKTVLKIKEEE